MKLLIVDDHAVNLVLLRAQLETEGHAVIEAANGVEALQALERERVDGIISDILMPEMDGFRLCLEVRKSKTLRSLPFIFYTSTYNSPGDRQLAHDLGADAYLTKPSPVPVIVDALLAAVRKDDAIGTDRVLPAEGHVLRQYNEALVRKLEDKNADLEETLDKLKAAHEQARRADARYRLVFENVPVGITMTGADAGLLSANPAFLRMLDYASADDAMESLAGSTLGAYIDSDARDDYLRILQRDGIVRNFETRLRRKDGAQIWVSLSGRPIRDLPGEESLSVTIVDDITLRVEHEARIARLSRIEAVQSSINSAMVRIRERQALHDEVCRIAVEQGGFRAAWVGWHDKEARLVRPIASAGHLDGFLELIRLSTDVQSDAEAGYTVRTLRGGVSLVNNEMATTTNFVYRAEALERGYRSTIHLPLKLDGATEGVLSLYAAEAGFFDDEERRLLEELAADVSFALDALQKSERLDFLAYYDPLTGLPNRRLFHDRLSHSLHARGGEAALIAVVLVDLERFRLVNETLGREAGDEMLREVGSRLQRANDSAARIGVDMFALLLRGSHSGEEVNRGIDAIAAMCFNEPVSLRGEELQVACRAGVALHPGDGADADTLLRNAEAALRRSKRAGERCVFYAPEMNARVAEALAIESRLRRALERNEFVLHYQPKVSLASGQITGVEALIRWQDPERGLVPPGRFIPILEDTGLIVGVGSWAIERALTDLGAWAAEGFTVPRVAVNVSAIQLQRNDFVDMVTDAVRRVGDAAAGLELEITESLLMRDIDASIRKLSVLRGLGIHVSMDDFGTGYSSLSYLARLPVDTIKIDRSFVSGMTVNAEDATIVSGIIALVHSLRPGVIAEGVETAAQEQHLAALDCDEAQGFYYCRPVPAAQIAALMRSGGALPGRPLA